MTDEPIDPRLDFRGRALAWAARTCTSCVGDILAWHPDGEAIRRRAAETRGDGDSLPTILWEELVASERRAARGMGRSPDDIRDAVEGPPATYWLRRRQVASWERWREVTRALPRPWVKLIEAPDAVVRAVQQEFGLEMIAAAMAGESSRKVITWLAALGNDLAVRVVERIREAAENGGAAGDGVAGKLRAPADVAARWRGAFERAAAAGAKSGVLAAALGRGMLGSLFRQLPDDRREAGRLSRSRLAVELEHDVSLEPATPDEREWAARIFAYPRIGRRIAGNLAADEPAQTEAGR